MAMPELPRLLLPQEAAELLRVPVPSAWRMAREGTIPGVVRIGRFIRFDRAALEGWIASGGNANNGDTQNTSAADQAALYCTAMRTRTS